jgi:hypothetical protein
MARRKTDTCRLRKVSCPDCGYVARVARSWLQVGLPGCPCGGTLEPDSAADRAYCGLITQDDVPAPLWTAICRENGWEDAIVRQGNAYKQWQRNPDSSLSNRRAGAAHCAHPGCGLWVAAGAEFCSAGHPQSDDAGATDAAAMPF